MQTFQQNLRTPANPLASASLPQPAANAHRSGSEAMSADAPSLGAPASDLPSDPGAVEYAAWLRLLRSAAP